MKRLPVYKHGAVVAYALVDDADAARFGRIRWNLSVGGYAWRVDAPEGRTQNTFLHRLVVGLAHGDPRFTDHINRRKLDCQRANLRIVTKPQNGQNQPHINGGISKFRGVDRHNGKWRVRVTIEGKQHHVGYFANQVAADRAARRFRREHMPFSTADQERMAS